MFSRFGGFTPYANNLQSIPSGIGGNSTGLLSSLFGSRSGVGAAASVAKKGINWSSLLTNTQKTLGIINQTIPTINQIKPIWNNAKTMFKVMNEFKKNDGQIPNNISKNNQNNYSQPNNYANDNINNSQNNNNSTENSTGPKFFI